MRTGQRHDQHAGRPLGEFSTGRVFGRNLVSGENVPQVAPHQMIDQADELIVRRRHPLQGGVAAGPHADPVAGQEVGDLVEMGNDAVEARRFRRHDGDELVVQLARARFVGGFAISLAAFMSSENIWPNSSAAVRRRTAHCAGR